MIGDLETHINPDEEVVCEYLRLFCAVFLSMLRYLGAFTDVYPAHEV